jgi:C-methyltransferase C-terminal domain/Putative zinc binding domain/Methyltransferase domain
LNNELTASLPFIEGRGGIFCRGCLGRNLFSGLDLGELPIANELLKSSKGSLEKFPLHLRVCSSCGLGQVADVVTPERIFRDYRYLSSMSTTFLQHASDFVNQRVQEGIFEPGDWVLEIASNDGYLLKNFIPFGITAIGVEPAENVADISRGLGIHTISEFFSSRLAQELLNKHGHPKLIIANNVMAHVPDLIDFIKGLEILCGVKTQISIENPSLANILVGMQFDTIYHEHYSYLSASAVAKISKENGLQLFKVDQLSIHGGSNRYWLCSLDDNVIVDPTVDFVMKSERESGLFEASEWKNYSLKVSKILQDFRTWLSESAEKGMRVYGYGAAAKASTILNSINLEAGLITAIADASLEKQNRFMPPHGIKIISPMQLFAEEPTDVVIFPWNIKSEIANYLRANLDEGVRLWCAIPEMRQVKP